MTRTSTPPTARETTLTSRLSARPLSKSRDALPLSYAPGVNLDRWMTASKNDGDFTVVDTALLNRYFRECHLEYGPRRQTPAAGHDWSRLLRYLSIRDLCVFLWT